MTETRICNTCKIKKSLDEFHARYFGKDVRCKECKNNFRKPKPAPRVLKQLFEDKSL